MRERDAKPQAEVDIQAYRPEWREAFYRLNAQWLQRHFVIEDVDERMLRDPERHVLAPGGTILFAVLDGEPIGTCALLKEDEGLYELSKMAVDEAHHGLGAGKLLLAAAIEAFHALGGGTLFLESSSKLTRALGMYERAGFVHQPAPRPGSHYARADVYMIYRNP
ncbi:MAG TPA: GNAT family N-acetyltransferase [Rhodanobacteraceae bacterium]|nr:GNAT family N-acetyltransferase [Rhodanobacteraceae bacterium]